MIPLCFPQEIAIRCDNGSELRLLAANPAEQTNDHRVDPSRIYLALEETLTNIKRLCINSGLPQPIVLPRETLNNYSSHPLPLRTFLEQPQKAAPAKISICLINGGGGGLGDGIMFAPALDILLSRLRDMSIEDIRLTLCTLLPGRTSSILGNIPGVRIAAMPVPLTDFLAHDTYADFSGMLTDPTFNTTHMTDLILERLGIDPLTIPPAAKEPFLNTNSPSFPIVDAALAQARAKANGKPLVAAIFISSYTRTMPEAQFAALTKKLATHYQPAIIFPEGFESHTFIERHNLTGIVSDLSAASPTFDHYFALLAGVDAIVSVDTSAVHIGAAFKKPTVALFNSIRLDTRITYSPTVQGIQLSFEGKQCHAPCGLSKARAYIEGKLANDQPFRLECGYACDEAIDREQILLDAITAAQSLPAHRQTPPDLETIRQSMATRLHEHLAPCWDTLDPTVVELALQQIITRSTKESGRLCPACKTYALHPRIGRYWGVDHYHCQTCEATFTDTHNLPAKSYRKNLPPHLPTTQFPAVPLIPSLLPINGTLLLASGSDDSWDETTWAHFFGAKSIDDYSHLLWDRRPQNAGLNPPPTGIYDAVISLCHMDNEQDPDTLVSTLLSHLKRGGLLIMPARNSQYLGHPVNNPQGASQGQPRVGWKRKTLSTILKRHGLEEIWTGTTPVTWQNIETSTGEFPALTIIPPGHENLTVKVAGHEITSLISQYLAHVLQSIHDHGQYWLCCARKTIEE